MNPADPTPATRLASAGPAPSGHVEVVHRTLEAYTAQVRGHEVTVDQPVTSGGRDEGPTPVELFVASLASCVAYYAGRFLQRHQLPYEDLRVDADFVMAADRPARVASVDLRIRPPDGLSAARLEGLRAVASHCTVHNTLGSPPRITVETC
ncbi:OsmC family protein [Streptomyces sp. BH097]|uniref:OsmC family protein n=1 Tax=unclassified Streptomyces TaxID=2593676 RepID=UPI003BB67E1B